MGWCQNTYNRSQNAAAFNRCEWLFLHKLAAAGCWKWRLQSLHLTSKGTSINLTPVRAPLPPLLLEPPSRILTDHIPTWSRSITPHSPTYTPYYSPVPPSSPDPPPTCSRQVPRSPGGHTWGIRSKGRVVMTTWGEGRWSQEEDTLAPASDSPVVGRVAGAVSALWVQYVERIVIKEC